MFLRTFSVLCTFCLLSLLSGCSSSKGFQDTESSFYTITLRDCHPSFEIELCDTNYIYRLFISARLSRSYQERYLPLELRFTSPSGQQYSDHISLPALYKDLISSPNDDILLKSSFGHYDVQWKYRDNVYQGEPGVWKIEILLPKEFKPIMGIGMSALKFTLYSNEFEK